jgi:phage baseplate assembly protein gpV
MLSSCGAVSQDENVQLEAPFTSINIPNGRKLQDVEIKKSISHGGKTIQVSDAGADHVHTCTLLLQPEAGMHSECSINQALATCHGTQLCRAASL